MDASSAAELGELVRNWRRRRKLSQLELASRAEVSARHLSFIENGRAKPSRELVLRLSEQLEVPVRQRNTLLVAAGYAPQYEENSLGAPRLSAVRESVDRLLSAHEPYPALVFDVNETVVAMNDAARRLMAGASPVLLTPPINLMRLALHPQGLSQYVVNQAEMRAQLLARLHRQLVHSGSEQLRMLYEEVSGYPYLPNPNGDGDGDSGDDVLSCLIVHKFDTELRLFSTVTTFGAATDITVAELSLEMFHPADARTADALKEAAVQGSSARMAASISV
ncbi:MULTISPECIES: helix-turn-helix transcriptional regulator [unclassified Streptomyces]|uniref:helix-turn-helix domain-containing protein n=1 Tax=unclassified Streptomyces TaxID=2593676 RepID=UPI0034099189